MLVKNSFEYDARVRNEAESLTRHGHQVTVVAIHFTGTTRRLETTQGGVDVVRVDRLYSRLAQLGGPSTVTPGQSSQQPGNTLIRRLLKAIQRVTGPPLRALNTLVLDRRMQHAAAQIRPDVLHAHDLNTLAPAVRAAAHCSAQVVYDAHELHTHRSQMGLLGRMAASVREQRLIQRADAVVTTTDTWADYLRGVYGISRPTVVRNVPRSNRAGRARDLRSLLRIPDDQGILLYQGSIQHHRGIEENIDALTYLDGCVLVVLGYGAHRPVLEERVARRGLEDRVFFHGPVPNDELVEWSAGADVGLCCIINASLSYYTSLPNKLFEYMAAGIPIVASGFPEMGRIVREEDVGEVCAPEDPVDIAAAIRRILDNPERAAECRTNSRKASSRYCWDLEEQRLLRTYEALADSS